MARSDAAFAAYDALEPADSGDTEEERHYEAAFAAFQAAEARVLGMVAPDLSGVALQLRIFAERFHCAELSEPEMSGEDRPAGAILRRIWRAWRKALELLRRRPTAFAASARTLRFAGG